MDSLIRRNREQPIVTGKPHGRLVEMDVLKCVAIFLVLWGHAQNLVSGECFDRPVYYHIYSFHMPLFMMISGFFFAMTLRGGFADTFRRKARQLLLPCAVCIVLFWLLDGLLFGEDMSLKHLLYRATHEIWFLKSAFICCMLGFLPFGTMKKHFWTAAVVTLAASQFIRTHQTAFMYPAFLTGGLIYMHFGSFRTHCRSIFIAGAAMCLLCNLFLDAPTYHWLLSRPKAMPEIIGMRLYKYTMGLSGAVAMMALAEWIVGRAHHTGAWIKTVARWGGMTLGIYLIHTFLLEDVASRYVNFDMLPAPVFDFIVSPAVALAVMAVCVMIINIIRRNDVAALLVLGISRPPEKGN